MNRLLSLSFLRNAWFYCALFLSGTATAQVVGGHLNNEPTPKVADAGKLSGGGYAGDVNLFNGTYSANIPLGTVSTPAGPSYSLNHSYSGSHQTGGVPEICRGIPYGEGWQVDLPSITIETDEYHRYSAATEQNENNPSHSDNPLEYTISDGIKENEIYWYNVHVNIPGVASGRAVFKHIDEKDNDCAVFVLNKFEQSIEIRFHGSFWTVTAPNGDIYEFHTHLAPYNNASNRRVIFYENDNTKPNYSGVNKLFNIVFSGIYNSSVEDDYRQAVLNVIEPKVSYSTWYCNLITNRNVPYQGIYFDYSLYGEFNYFKEFQQTNMPWAFHQRLGNTTLPYTHDYTSYKDVILRKVWSYVLETPLDIIDLNYETDFSVISTSGNRMINFNHEGSGRLDSLYSYKNLLHNGQNIADFQNWSRYQHQSTVAGGSPNNSNPYVSGNSYYKSSVDNDDEIPFTHSFLASPRLLALNDFIPGDIYEIRTKVRRNSSTSVINGNGLIDIKIVSGTRGYNQDNIQTHYAAPNLGNGNISVGEFEKYNGIELFSTHNRAIKWSITHNTGSVTTSNFFVLPNLPTYFGGLSIQIGPANSDHHFAIDNLIATGANQGQVPNGYNTYHHMNLGPNTPRSASTIPHNFGVGMPWSLVLPIYQFKMTGGELGQVDQNGLTISGSFFNFWAKGNNNNSGWDNRPTKFDQNVKLSEVQLLRYSKNPYMLKSVKQYRINGEYNGHSSQASEDTSHVLIAHKEFEYNSVLDNVFENFNYAVNDPVLVSNHYKQVKVYLARVREMPVTDEFVAFSIPLDTSEIPTTFLTYSDYSDILPTYQDTLVLGTKVRALTSFVDHLGGHTRIHYYPITSKATYSQHNYSTHWSGIADLGVAQRYGLNKAFTIFPAVKELIKWDEKNLDISNASLSGHKKWTYVYDTVTPRLAAMSKPSTNIDKFRYKSNSRQTYRGFKKTTVYDPPDDQGNRSYTQYSFYGKEMGQPIDIVDFLLIGKLKESKSYRYNGQIQSETLIEYDYTRAFVNGRDRPNFLKGASYYEIMMGENEYRDWYKEDYLEAEDLDENPVTGYEAQLYYSTPHFNGDGGYVKRPKFMEYYFYEDLLSRNPAYYFHSYFVKKVKERTRTYENQLAKSTVVLPVAEPWVYGADATFISDIPNGTECNEEVKAHVLAPKSNSKSFLLAQGKICDSILVSLVESDKWISSDKRQLLINQNGLSAIIWEEIFQNMSKFRPNELVQILEYQPVVITPVQFATLNNIAKRPSDEFLERVFMKNEYLQDTVMFLILERANEFPENQVDSIFARQPQLSGKILSELIKSKYLSSNIKKEILSKNVLTDSLYELILSEFKGVEVEYIVTLSPSYPSDSILSLILDKNYDTSVVISIFQASPREFSEWIETKVKTLYLPAIADIILGPSLNIGGLLQYCNNPLQTGRVFIDNITEYSYYEANEKGRTLSDGFIDLLGMDDVPGRQVTFNGFTKTIDSLQLKHEPSWQVYSVKKSSPQLGGAFSQEKYYYYYDLLNRYDRWWFMYDAEGGWTRNEPFITTFMAEDTVTNVYVWNEEYLYGMIPQIDGMVKSREHTLKTIPFQVTSVSKNRTDEFALSKSTYYDYDARWFPDDFTVQQVVDYEGESCPPIVVDDPCERIYDCTPCYLYKYHGDAPEERDLPYGYCSYTNSGGNTYFCPMTVDVTPWFGQNYVTNLCKDGYNQPGGGGGGNHAQVPQDVLSKTLQLRSVYTQLDTLKYESGMIGYIPNNSSALDEMNAFFRLKMDTGNTNVAEFWMGGPDEMDGNNRLPYRMILPHDALRTTHINQRNRYLQPTLTENSSGLKTRYYYRNALYFFYRNTACQYGIGSYTASLNTDIGLPYRVTVGYGRNDSLSTTYAYSKTGMLKETVSPNMKKMNFTFDTYNRLYEVREAETRLLSQNTYHYWDHNQTLDFEERAQMNYVMSTIYSDENTREWKKAFIDPLGRDFGAISAIDSQQKQVHSGAVVYDNLSRVIEAHKPHYLESAQFVSVKNYNVPSMQTVYENAPKSRTLRTYDFGVAQSEPHYTSSTYHITNNVYAACELDLATSQTDFLFGSGNSDALRFYRTLTRDQDGKELISYTNAAGQQIATLRYVGLDEKVTTLFAYDSYGNLTTTINANHQRTDYAYNILGQMYLETTVDAGKKRYMYNKQGQVSAVQDEIARAHKDENNDPAPYYRKFEFDDYGRLLAVKRVYYSPYHDAFRYSDGWIHDGYDEPVQDGSGEWNYLKYTFSNNMTMDWLGDYTTFAWVQTGGGQGPDKITLYGLPDGGAVYEKKWTYGTVPASHNLGQLVEVESYDNKGLPFQGTEYPVQKATFKYNDLEQLVYENISFNPTRLGGNNDPLLTVESVIAYTDYNYRGALLKKQVDVNDDGVIDLTYFNVVDDWNRLREVYVALGDAQDASQASKVADYKYNDALGQLTDKRYYAYNNLINEDDVFHHTTYTYDVRDRLGAITSGLMDYHLYYDNQLVGPDSWGEPIMHGFNHNGNINGAYVQYDWAHTDMPGMAQMEEQLLYGYTYDKLNRLTRADATVGDYVTDQQHTNIHDFYRIGDVNYKYDHIGNLTQTVRILPETFADNALKVQELNYGYQNDRNRLQNVFKTGVYNRSFTYDLSGNLLTDSEKGITKTDYGRAAYPFAMRVTNPVTSQQFLHSYLYDANDLRIFKGTEAASSSDFKKEYYLKDIAVYDMIENEWTYYVNTNERIAKIIPIEDQVPGNNANNTEFTLKTTQISFYETDHLGNTRIVFSSEKFNGDGSVDRKIHFAADYYPYGKTLRYFETSTFEEKYLTTQHERDRETGFDYRGARYYDSDLGRFLSLDPLSAEFPAWSAYNYVMGNPIMLIDPDGKAPQDWVQNIYTGAYEWNEDATSEETTPEGYEYVGKEHIYRGEGGLLVELRDNGEWGYYETPANQSFSMGLARLHNYYKLFQHDFDGLPGLFEYLETGGQIGWIKYEYWSGKGKLVGPAPVGGAGPLGWIVGGPAKAVSLTAGVKTSYSVYRGFDAGGKIRYIGITSRNASIRFGEHAAAGGEKGALFFETMKGAEGLTKTQARVMEQTLINTHGLSKNGGLLMNKINSISPTKWGQYGIK